MTRTKLSPEVEKWLEDHPAPERPPEGGPKLEDLKREWPSADRRAWPPRVRAWSLVDWLIVAAIISCVALLVKLVTGP